MPRTVVPANDRPWSQKRVSDVRRARIFLAAALLSSVCLDAAVAMERLLTETMNCAPVQARVQSQGTVILRRTSKKVPWLPIFNTYVHDERACGQERLHDAEERADSRHEVMPHGPMCTAWASKPSLLAQTLKVSTRITPARQLAGLAQCRLSSNCRLSANSAYG